MFMKKQNIMYILNDSIAGGAMLSFLDMLVKITDRVNVVVVIPDQPSVMEQRLKELKVIYYKMNVARDDVPIGCGTNEDVIHNFKVNYESALELLPIIKREKIHLVHINSSVSNFGAIAALMMNIPYVWHIRELLEEQFGCEFYNQQLKMALYQRADCLISISDYVKSKYIDKYAINTVRIYNGLDIKKFKAIIYPGQYKNVFLAAGAITPKKGQWDAVRAVEHLISKGHGNIQLIIAGMGNDLYIWLMKKYINRKGLQKHIVILPFQDDLSQLRTEVSYALTCSQNEALGRVTIEAMLAGNIVIGAKSGGTTELIGEHEERGYLYCQGDYQSMSEAMLKAINCPADDKDLMRYQAQHYAEMMFDSEKYCERLVHLYEEIVDSYMKKDNKSFLKELEEYYQKIASHCEDIDNEVVSKKSFLKLQNAYELTLRWLEIRQRGHRFEEFFAQKCIKSVAIYGMAELGRRLYDEIECSSVEIKYLIDKNPVAPMKQFLDFTSIDEVGNDVDAIIVTAVMTEKQLVDELKNRGYKEVIGLSEILDYFT